MEALKKRNDLFQVTALANTGVLTASSRIFCLWFFCTSQAINPKLLSQARSPGSLGGLHLPQCLRPCLPPNSSLGGVLYPPIRKQSFQGQFSVANDCGGGRAHPVHCSRCPSGRIRGESSGSVPGALCTRSRCRSKISSPER